MSKIAVMQPYLFPYIGYFHLIDSVDIFVSFDDVNFIKKGWINRNKILSHGKAHLWSIPLVNKSQNRKICDHEIFEPEKAQARLAALIEKSYHKAPNFDEVMPLIYTILDGQENMIDQLAIKSLKSICSYLNVDTIFKSSADLKKNPEDPAQKRIIDMVKSLGGTAYHNAIGGKELYEKEYFAREDIKLSFIESHPVTYKQFGQEAVPYLSIIDVLMFNKREETRDLMQKYRLV